MEPVGRREGVSHRTRWNMPFPLSLSLGLGGALEIRVDQGRWPWRWTWTMGTSVLSCSGPSVLSPPFQPFQTLALPPTVSSPSQLPAESNQTQTHCIFLDKVNTVLVGGRDWNLRSSLCLECLSLYLKNHSILVNGEREKVIVSLWSDLNLLLH